MKIRCFAMLMMWGLCLAASAQTIASDAGLFPDKTLGFISISPGKKCKQQWKKTPFAQILKEPEVREFLTVLDRKIGLKKELREFSRRFASVFGMKIKDIFSMTDRCSMGWINVPKGSEPIAFGMVISFESKHQDDAEKLLARVLDVLPIQKTEYQLGDLSVHKLKGLENTVYYVQLQGRFLFATTKELMAEMAGRITTEKPGSLAGQVNFAKFIGKLPGDPFLCIYLNAKGLKDQLWWFIPDEIHRPLDVLGFCDWQSLGTSFSFDENGFFTYLALELNAKPKGVNLLIPARRLSPDSFCYIPEKSAAGMVIELPLAKIWQEFLHCYQETAPELFYAFQQDLQKVERAFFNFSVTEFSENVGPSFTLFQMPGEGLVPTWVLVGAVKDEVFIRKVCDNLASIVSYRFKSKLYRGHTIYYLAADPEKLRHSYRETVKLQLSHDERAMLRALLGTFSFYLEDGKIIAAPLPQTIMDFIDYRESKKPSRSMDWAKPVPGDNYTALAYLDVRDYLTRYYHTFLPFLPPFEEIGQYEYYFPMTIETSTLPRISTITGHMSPVKMGIAKDGLYYCGIVRSNLGLEFILPFVGTVFAADESVGSPLVRFTKGFDRFLRTHEKAEKLEKENRCYAASKQWQRLSKRTAFEYFRYIAEQNKKRLTEKWREQSLAVQKKLEVLADSKYLGKWQMHGDWIARDGYIFGISGDESCWLISGKQPFTRYVLEMEVMDIDNSFQVWCHWKNAENEYGYPDYQSVSFAENENLKGQWVPLKIKVKGPFVSYWYGPQHYRVRASRGEGLVGIALPANSSAKIRNIKLSEVKVPEAAVEPSAPKVPSLHISCRDNFDPVATGEKVTYLVTLSNEGGVVADNVVIDAIFSDSLKYLRALGKKLSWKRTGHALSCSGFSIRPGEKLELRFEAKAVEKGAASLQLAVSFAGTQGKFVLTEYTIIR